MSTVELRPCLHTHMGEVQTNLAYNDGQSCCWDKAKTGASRQHGGGKQLADALQEPGTSAGTALPGRLQTLPQTQLLLGHPLCPATCHRNSEALLAQLLLRHLGKTVLLLRSLVPIFRRSIARIVYENSKSQQTAVYMERRFWYQQSVLRTSKSRTADSDWKLKLDRLRLKRICQS